MKLPPALTAAHNDAALDLLRCYYGRGGAHAHRPYDGAWFDSWDSSGDRAASSDRFTADDVVAVTFLSVSVPPRAVIELLHRQSADFTALLQDLGPDRDLASETDAFDDDWVGWKLHERLAGLQGVGATTASKLLARKRPRLRPIYDSQVAEAVDSHNIWEPLRAALQVDDLHARLLRLRDSAGLGESVSAIRVFDVVTWMGQTVKGCPA